MPQWFVACCRGLLGFFDEADEALATVPAVGMNGICVQLLRAILCIDNRKLDEASALAAWVIQEADAQSYLQFSLEGRLYLAEANLYKGALEEAESYALALSDILVAEPYIGLLYLSVLARIRLAQERTAEAKEIAERAYSQTKVCGMGYSVRHAMLLLVRAEALQALGEHAAACQAIREAQDDLLRRAAKIPDPEVRRSFLENIPDHRRTLDLAREWLVEKGNDKAVNEEVRGDP